MPEIVSGSPEHFSVGYHRPIYLWGGPGTVRMNRLKFMGAPNDEAVHAEAHTTQGALRISDEAGFNWAYLMYDWGFPPEIEQQDWDDFIKAVPIYHQHGVKVFGYIQASNCVYSGTYTHKDWYALTPKGNYTHYYTGRYMTCWLHPEWLAHLRDMISGVIQAGADGVFFDNPWLGIQPLHFGGAWTGPAGCYCPRCCATYQEATGYPIPTKIDPAREPNSRDYLAWRAEQVTRTLASLANYARSLNPDILISANDYNAIMQPAFATHGIDLSALADPQDVVMIENFSLPRWARGDGKKAPELVNNALTIRTARALVGDTPLTTDPYDQGIGFDDVYPARRFQTGLAEAAACGTAMVVKGTEFVNQDGTFTLLTSPQYVNQRAAIGHYHQWLREHTELYQGRRNNARIGLLYPHIGLRFDWDKIAPLYFAACQALTYNSIPWRTVGSTNDLDSIDTLLYFEPETVPIPQSLRAVFVPGLDRWSYPQPSFLTRHPDFRHNSGKFLGWYYQAYFKYRWARWLADSLRITQWFLVSPHFKIPLFATQTSLLEKLGELAGPGITWSESPVLVETWRKGHQQQIHLVNYYPRPQTIQVSFGQPESGKVISPDQGETVFNTSQLAIELDIYTILLINKPGNQS